MLRFLALAVGGYALYRKIRGNRHASTDVDQFRGQPVTPDNRRAAADPNKSTPKSAGKRAPQPGPL
jgi:hypothetical protein